METINKIEHKAEVIKWKVGIIAILLFIVSIFYFYANQPYVVLGGERVRVEIADTEAEQKLGLAGKRGLREKRGMLFVFQTSGKYGFWMENMKFAIDMLWISEDGKIVHIEKNVTPETYPNIFGSDEEARYVLEVAAGFSDKYGVKEGDIVEINM